MTSDRRPRKVAATPIKAFDGLNDWLCFFKWPLTTWSERCLQNESGQNRDHASRRMLVWPRRIYHCGPQKP